MIQQVSSQCLQMERMHLGSFSVVFHDLLSVPAVFHDLRSVQAVHLYFGIFALCAWTRVYQANQAPAPELKGTTIHIQFIRIRQSCGTNAAPTVSTHYREGRK